MNILKKNLKFCIKYEPNNEYLRIKKDWVDVKVKSKTPTVPFYLKDEFKTNIFFRCNQQSIKNALNLDNSSEQEIFDKLRDLKDNF